MNPLDIWRQRRREAQRRAELVDQRLAESNQTLRDISDVVLRLRVNAEHLEDVIEQIVREDG